MRNPWLMLVGSVTEPRSMAMQDEVNAPQRAPWNKGKLTGSKPPLRPNHGCSIRTKLQIEGRTRPRDVQSGDRQQASRL